MQHKVRLDEFLRMACAVLTSRHPAITDELRVRALSFATSEVFPLMICYANQPHRFTTLRIVLLDALYDLPKTWCRVLQMWQEECQPRSTSRQAGGNFEEGGLEAEGGHAHRREEAGREERAHMTALPVAHMTALRASLTKFALACMRSTAVLLDGPSRTSPYSASPSSTSSSVHAAAAARALHTGRPATEPSEASTLAWTHSRMSHGRRGCPGGLPDDEREWEGTRESRHKMAGLIMSGTWYVLDSLGVSPSHPELEDVLPRVLTHYFTHVECPPAVTEAPNTYGNVNGLYHNSGPHKHQQQQQQEQQHHPFTRSWSTEGSGAEADANSTGGSLSGQGKHTTSAHTFSLVHLLRATEQACVLAKHEALLFAASAAIRRACSDDAIRHIPSRLRATQIMRLINIYHLITPQFAGSRAARELGRRVIVLAARFTLDRLAYTPPGCTPAVGPRSESAATAPARHGTSAERDKAPRRSSSCTDSGERHAPPMPQTELSEVASSCLAHASPAVTMCTSSAPNEVHSSVACISPHSASAVESRPTTWTSMKGQTHGLASDHVAATTRRDGADLCEWERGSDDGRAVTADENEEEEDVVAEKDDEEDAEVAAAEEEDRMQLGSVDAPSRKAMEEEMYQRVVFAERLWAFYVRLAILCPLRSLPLHRYLTVMEKYMRRYLRRHTSHLRESIVADHPAVPATDAWPGGVDVGRLSTADIVSLEQAHQRYVNARRSRLGGRSTQPLSVWGECAERFPATAVETVCTRNDMLHFLTTGVFNVLFDSRSETAELRRSRLRRYRGVFLMYANLVRCNEPYILPSLWMNIHRLVLSFVYHLRAVGVMIDFHRPLLLLTTQHTIHHERRQGGGGDNSSSDCHGAVSAGVAGEKKASSLLRAADDVAGSGSERRHGRAMSPKVVDQTFFLSDSSFDGEDRAYLLDRICKHFDTLHTSDDADVGSEDCDRAEEAKTSAVRASNMVLTAIVHMHA